jgi:PKD repeat protein
MKTQYINILRSSLLALIAALFIFVSCKEDEEQPAPDVSAYFKTRNVVDEQHPLEAPVDMIFVNASKHGLAYHWDFGQGYLKNDPDKSNTYLGISPDTVRFEEPGTYEVKVTVEGGAEDKVYTQTYVVNKEVPTISFSPESILPEDLVQFDVSFYQFEGTTPTFEWTFEDGDPATSSARNPQVSFTSAGDKQVTLKLNDGEELLTVQTLVRVKEELAPTLYFTDMATKQIYMKRIFMTAETDAAEPVVSTGIVLPDNSKPMTMFVDGNRVYVTNTDKHTGTATFGEILSFGLDGSGKKTVATGGAGHYVPFSMTVVGSDLYFTDRFNGIHKIAKSAENLPMGAETLWLHHNQTAFYGAGIGWGNQNGTVASHNGKLWWTKNSNGKGVYIIDPSLPKNDAGMVTGDKLMENFAIRSMFIDAPNNKAYFFLNQPSGALPIGMYVANTDGTEVTLIEQYAPGTNLDDDGSAAQYLGITGIAVLGEYVYWGYRNAGNDVATSGIKRAKLDGSEVEMYLPGYLPYGIAVDTVPR